MRQVLASSLLPIGILGAWRLARPIGSLRAGIAAFVVYAAVPVPYNALARGSWGGLVAYAVAPWVVLQLARASQLAPVRARDLADDSPEASATPRHAVAAPPDRRPRSRPGRGCVVPAVRRRARPRHRGRPGARIARGRSAAAVPDGCSAVGAGATLTAGVLHLPWTWDLVGPDARWDVFAGIGSTDSGDLSAASLLRFETGPHGGVAGLRPADRGRPAPAHRAGLALRVGGAGLVRGPGRVGARLGRSGGLVPGTVAPSRGADRRRPGPGSRWPPRSAWPPSRSTCRATASGGARRCRPSAALAVLLGILPLASGIADGRWKMPGGDLDRPMGLVLDQAERPPGRVLWVGDPEVVPAGGFRYDDRLTFATTEGLPTLEGRWAAPEPVSADLPGDALRLAVERRTSRLGALLAPMGVQYIVVPNRNAPSAYSGVSRPPPETSSRRWPSSSTSCRSRAMWR